MPAGPIRYQSDDEDSGRWTDFPFRDGDIVISTRSRSGTTWLQMICALLIFQQPRPPAPLTQLSPWLDWRIRPADEVYARLEAQQHRRFIKTHTPLDGLPLDDRATYIVVARDPRDMYVSLYHQGANIDRDVVRRLLGKPTPTEPIRPVEQRAGPEVRQALLSWIDRDTSPQQEMDSIRGVMWHLSDAWLRRQEPNIILVHYRDLQRDLESAMRRLAALLEIEVCEDKWPALVQAATFVQMRGHAHELVPNDGASILKDVSAFFRRGTSGAWRELLSDGEVAHYDERVAALAPADLLTWLHR